MGNEAQGGWGEEGEHTGFSASSLVILEMNSFSPSLQVTSKKYRVNSYR